MVLSSSDLILLYRRQSSVNNLVVEVTDDRKSLINIIKSRGQRTVPGGTLHETVLAEDV